MKVQKMKKNEKMKIISKSAQTKRSLKEIFNIDLLTCKYYFKTVKHSTFLQETNYKLHLYAYQNTNLQVLH
jgi:hypothetical protein